MPQSQTATLYLEVTYDPELTDAESLAKAMDILMETALSTPDLLDDYGNPGVGPFYATGRKSSRHVATLDVSDPDTEALVAVEIRKTEGGYLVGIDGSYLEQEVGPVYDPCDFGVELSIDEEEETNE
jgi:hypothetical protein